MAHSLDPETSAEMSLRSAARRLQRSAPIAIEQHGPAGDVATSSTVRALAKRVAAMGLTAVAFAAAAQQDPSTPRMAQQLQQILNTDVVERPSPWAQALAAVGLPTSRLSSEQQQKADDIRRGSGRKLYLVDTNDILSMRAGVARFTERMSGVDLSEARATFMAYLVNNRPGYTAVIKREVANPQADSDYCLVGVPLSSSQMDPVVKNIILAHELGHCATVDVRDAAQSTNQREVMADVYSALVYLRSQDPENPDFAPLLDVRDTRLFNLLGEQQDALHDTTNALNEVIKRYRTPADLRALKKLSPSELIDAAKTIAAQPGLSMTTVETNRQYTVVGRIRRFVEAVQEGRQKAAAERQGIPFQPNHKVAQDTDVLVFDPEEREKARQLAEHLERAMAANPTLDVVGGMLAAEALTSLRLASTTGELPPQPDRALKLIGESQGSLEPLLRPSQRVAALGTTVPEPEDDEVEQMAGPR